jgi:hypothetical protein
MRYFAIDEMLKKPDYAALSRDFSEVLLADAESGLMEILLSLIITNNLNTPNERQRTRPTRFRNEL